MKKSNLLMCALLTAALAFCLTACTPMKDTNHNVTEENNVEIPQDAPAFPVNSGMGIEGGNYFATPFCNGEPLDITAMTEIRITADDYDIGTGACVNLTGLDYTVTELDDSYAVLAAGDCDFNDSYNYYEYDREFEVYIDFLDAFEFSKDPEYQGEYEVIDDISFHLYSDSLCAIKWYNDAAVCVDIYWGDKEETVDANTIQGYKAEMQNILAGVSFVDEVEPTYATIFDFDTISFDCGWYMTGLDNVSWNVIGVEAKCKEERDSSCMSLRLSISKISTADMEDTLAYADEEVFDVLTDESGKEIGYIDTYERDNNTMKYYIRLEDGSYMVLRIYNSYTSSFFDIHDWSEVKALLNNGN